MECRKAREGRVEWAGQQQLSKCSASPPLGSPLAFQTSGTVVGALHFPSSPSLLSDPHHFDPNPDPACHFDADLDPNFHLYADPDLDPRFQIKIQNLEKSLK